MKTNSNCASGKSCLVALLLTATAFWGTPAALGQAIASAREPVAGNKTVSANATGHFQALAYAIKDTEEIKVVFDNPLGRLVIVRIKDEKGQLLYSKFCRDTRYVSKFSLSALGNGIYKVTVSEVKGAFSENTYRQTFQIGSSTKRSLRPFNPKLQKELYTPRHSQAYQQ